MKTIKALGLTLVAATATTGALGVPTAVASTEAIALCKTAELACPEASQYPAGTVIKGRLKTGTNLVLSGSLKIECAESEIGIETKGLSLSTSLLGKWILLSFKKCTTCPTWNSLLTTFGEAHLRSAGNLRGELIALSIVIHQEGCFGFAKCTLSAGAVELDVDSSVQPVVVKAVNEKLSVSGFGCGSEATLNAEYVLTSPTPLFIES